MSFFSFILLLACGDKGTDDTAGSDDTAGADDTANQDTASFQGMNFVFKSAEGFELLSDKMTLGFSAQTLEMSFDAGCNSHFGTYTVNDGVFEVSQMGGTEMGCDTALMEQDSWLVGFFTSSPNVNHEGDMLTFTGTDATLIFQDEEVAVPDLLLADVSWEVDTYLDGEVATTYNIESIPNFYFASDGSFTLNSGCNGASGSYTDNGGTLSINIDVITDAICEGDINTVEGHIFQVFNGTPSYEIQGERITLMAGDKGISGYASLE